MTIEARKTKKTNHDDAFLTRLFSNSNIFQSIYSANSYIFNCELLDIEDYNDLMNPDYFNVKKISSLMKAVTKRLHQVIDNGDYFKCKVFFKPKKVKNNIVEYRPLHICDLVDSIAIGSILNCLLTERRDNVFYLNDLSKSLPNCFYGNIPSIDPGRLFHDWRVKYKEYSEITKQTYEQSLETLEFEYEVSLDLVNFFPSINPIIMEHLLKERITSDIRPETLRIILHKLLFVQIINFKNKEIEKYYTVNEDVSKNIKVCFTKGLPQGLPQSYIFGNICMLEIKKIYEKVYRFDDKFFFYVDDSVIFTNKYRGKNHLDELKNDVLSINVDLKDTFTRTKSDDEIDTYLRDMDSLRTGSKNDFENICYIYKNVEYIVKIHEPGDKTEITKIKDDKFGAPYLSFLGRIISHTPFELFSIFDDDEHEMTKAKIHFMLTTVNKEIGRIDEYFGKSEHNNDKSEVEAYKSKLKRYVKFLSLRESIMELNDNDSNVNHDKNISILNELLDMEKSPGNTEIVIEKLSNMPLLFSIANYLKTEYSQKNFDEIYRKICDIEHKFFSDVIDNCRYFSTFIMKFEIKSVKKRNSFNPYTSLSDRVREHYNFGSGNHSFKRTKLLLDKVYVTLDLLNQCCHMNSGCDLGNNPEYARFISSFPEFDFRHESNFKNVCMGDHSLYRMISNATVSLAMGVDIDGNLIINKKSNKQISYRELRILTYIRIGRFSLPNFIIFLKRIEKEEIQIKIDHSINEAIPFFAAYINDPSEVDILIQTHRFVSEIWRNGSKYLHFYTLHNHEHAIELIKASVKFLRSNDFLTIKKTDAFLLFMACYLHDVSMVVYPDIKSMFLSRNSDVLISNIQHKVLELNKTNYDFDILKKDVLGFYQEIDYFFEKSIRDRHGSESAMLIRIPGFVDFVPQEHLNLIAAISEAHTYDAIDIYHSKSLASKTYYSEKYMTILLRIADLLDVSNSRISSTIYDKHSKFMSDTTFFHWISHKVVDRYSIKTEYRYQDNIEKQKKRSYLSKGAIIETITITFDLNVNETRRLDNPNKKKCLRCYLLKKTKGNTIVYNLEENMRNHYRCSFMCAWMREKHHYLFNELSELQSYLERSNSLFLTRFQICFNLGDSSELSSRESQVVFDKINKLGF